MISIIPYRNSLAQRAPRGSLTLLDPFPWVDRLFEDNWGEVLQSGLDFDEKSQKWSTELNLAGYKKEDIKVEVNEGTVTITAENEKRGKAVRSYYVSEADPDRIEAKLDHGVLSLSLPKRADKVPKKIAIT